MNTNHVWMKLLAAVAFLAFLLLAACAPANEIQSTEGQALVEQGDAYMACMQNSDLKCAYGLLSPSAQQQVDQAKELAAGVANVESLFKAYGPRLSSWTFDQARFSTREGIATGTLQGEVKYLDGETGKVRLELEKDGEAWKVRSSSLE
jgi:hypothetical protein